MPDGKPNILVIWGDDIGISNLSCYSDGLMGYHTPNIDRIANEGMRFTDSYGEQSCTAGRAAFISGQSVYRTGMSKVGMPGARYRLGRRGPDHRRTAQAARLRHGPVRQEPLRRSEQVPADRARLRRVLRQSLSPQRRGGTRAVRLSAQGPIPEAPRLRVAAWCAEVQRHRRSVQRTRRSEVRPGRQADHRGHRAAGHQADGDHRRRHRRRAPSTTSSVSTTTGNPFFVWCNFTHMHAFTHTKPESLGQAGLWQSGYHDTMIDHDKNVGTVLDALDELGIADDTIVIYSTDNGPHRNSWPDAGTTPFRSEKDTNWEGAFRVPELIRWPGKIKAGTVSNDIIQHHDWLPTLLAAAGDPDISEKLKKGSQGRRRRQDRVQGAHRRLQPAAVPDGRGRDQPTAGFLLLLRRRRSRCDALRELEGRVHGTALPGHAANLGRALHHPAGAVALQPAHRPLRVRRTSRRTPITTG